MLAPDHALASTAPGLAVKRGDLVAGRFEVETVAGAGGMGEVWKGTDRETGAPVAVKVLRREAGGAAPRFVREARLLAELEHPGIVRYLAHGTSAEGELFLAMEWLDGEDLGARLQRGPLTVEESTALVRKAAEAVAVAHAQGVVHRDLKPNNLFLVGGDPRDLRVLDFGIARRLASNETATLAGGMVGTAGYMAPEQVQGLPNLDARADVFALGCILYECITGAHAFEGASVVAVLMKILLEEPPRLRGHAGVPAHVEALLARMLTKDPRERPADGAEVAAALAAYAGADEMTPGQAPRAAVGPALTRFERRLLVVILALGALPDRAQPETGSGTVVMQSTSVSTVRAMLEPFGAHVQRLADGSVLAVFTGTGSASELALRGARSALALRASLPDAPIAVATGRGTENAGLSAGEVVERVAALARKAPKGGAVRVDEATAGLLDARFDIARRAAGIDLDGEHEPVDATRTLLGKPTRFLGRDRELSTLEGLAEACAEESTARAVIVIAAAGAGKSRLGRELLSRLGDAETAPAIWTARGDPMRAGASLTFVRQMLRRALEIPAGDDAAAHRPRIEARVARSVSVAHRARVAEFLGEIVLARFPDDASVPLQSARRDPALMADQMRRAWEDFVLGELRTRPVVLVLEDLHWGDAASVAYVDAALRAALDQRLLVVALARPEVATVFPDLWKDRELTRLALGPMSRKASETLVRSALAGRATDDEIGRIVALAAGNAFYLEELVRGVAEGRGRELPPTVAAMVQARLESFEPDDRRLLRAASVFGEVFWESAAAALLGGSAQSFTVREQIDWLVDKELVVRQPESRFAGERELVFRHGLVRQAAYDGLTEGDRRLGHELAARWLEAHGEPDAAVLADHLEKAGALAEAVPRWVSAVRAALDANDLRAAVSRADRGVACGASGAELAALRLDQAEALHWSGDGESALPKAEEALALFPSGSDGWARAITEVISLAALRHDAASLATRSEELTRALAAPDARPSVIRQAARAAVYFLLGGEADRTEALVRAVEARAAEVGVDPAFDATILQTKGRVALIRGDIGAFHDLNVIVVARRELIGDARGACLARTQVAYAALQLGRFADAVELNEAARREGLRLGLGALATLALHNLGLALARVGRLEEAKATELAAIVECASLAQPMLLGASHLYVAWMRVELGELLQAEADARRALELLAPFPLYSAYTHAMLAHALRAAGRSADALEAARASMRFFDEHGAEEGEAFACVVAAELLIVSGARAEARPIVARAAARLVKRAESIVAADQRASYLGRVPDNARLLELAAELA